MAASAAQAVTAYLTGAWVPPSTNDLVNANGTEAAPPSGLAAPHKLVLGFLAEHGPSRAVDVLGHVSAEAAGTPLSSIARALEDLIAAGTLESRDDDVVSVSGDPRT